MSNFNHYYAFVPEIGLAVGACSFFLSNLLVEYKIKQGIFNQIKITQEKYENSLIFRTFYLLFITLIITYSYDAPSTSYYVNDLRNVDMKIAVLLFSLPVTILIGWSSILQASRSNEFFTIFLFFIFSILVGISANDFIFFYLAIELQFFCILILLNVPTKNVYYCQKSRVFYFIINATISAIMLCGISHLYGLFGTTNFSTIRLLTHGIEFSMDQNSYYGASIFCFLIIVGIFAKLGVYPLQNWMPSIYENLSLPVTILVSVFPKIILTVFIIKLYGMFDSVYINFEYAISFIGVLTTYIAAKNILQMKRFKVFLIISSFASTGLLIVLFGNLSAGISKYVYYYLIVYTITTILSWSIYIIILKYINTGLSYNERNMDDKIDPITLGRLASLGISVNKVWGIIFSLIFLSFSGLPTLATFLIKFVSIGSFIYTCQYFLLILSLIISSVSTFYYVRLVQLIMDPSAKEKVQNIKYNMMNTPVESILFRITVVIIVLCLFLLMHAYLYADFWLAFFDIIASSAI